MRGRRARAGHLRRRRLRAQRRLRALLVVEALVARGAVRRSRTRLRVARDAEATIGEIEAFCRDHGIDAHFRRSGWLWTATSQAQMGAWEGVVALCERLGVGPFRRLSPEEIARRAGSPVHRAGVLDVSAAIVQPAMLARGLRKAALESGVKIYENTRVRSFTRASPVLIRCDDGRLSAGRLVIASNAWAAGIRELSRRIVGVTSDMVVTAPAPDRLAEAGWTGGEGVTDSQTMIDYYHVTRGGRVAFGKGGWGIALGGRIGARFDRDRRRARMVEADFRRVHPGLASLAGHARLVRTDRPDAEQPADLRASRRPPADRLRRGMERQRCRAERARREDPREPRSRAGRRLGTLSADRAFGRPLSARAVALRRRAPGPGRRDAQRGRGESGGETAAHLNLNNPCQVFPILKITTVYPQSIYIGQGSGTTDYPR